MRSTKYALIFFLLGVGLHSCWPMVFVAGWGWLVAGSVMCGSISCLEKKEQRVLFFVCGVALLVGAWRFQMVDRREVAAKVEHRFVVHGKVDAMSFQGKLFAWRSFLSGRIRSLFKADEAELLIGMLYGGQTFSIEAKATFQRAGLMHLVAVSGSNVTIVVTVMLALALGMRLRRRMAFYGTSVALLLFVLFVGFSASVLRAALMGWLGLLGREVGRIPDATYLLLVTAALLVAQNPLLLGFDASFGLSFLAMWGVLVWAPKMQERMWWLPEKFGLRENAATTIAATLMTAPYLAWMFGRVSGAGVLINLLALPFVPFIMLWGALATALGGNLIGVVVGVVAHGLLSAVLMIAGWSAWFPWLDWKLNISFVTLLMMYVLIFAWWTLWKRAKVIHKMKR